MKRISASTVFGAIIWYSWLPSYTRAAVTVYGLTPLGMATPTGTPSSADALQLGQFDPAEATDEELTALGTLQLAAYNDTRIPPPAPHNPPVNANFTIALPHNAQDVAGISIPHRGDFFGFSIEMSVVGQVLGKNSTHIQVPFLNLMGNIKQRAGQIRVRLGGNTQEFAGYVEELENHRAISKASDVNPRNPTLTPAVIYTRDLFYLAGNISDYVNVQWFLGIPFNQTDIWRLQIAELGQQILGDRLIGLQAGNEPDLYVSHHHRPDGWHVEDYNNEMESLIAAIDSNPNIPVKNMLVAPSIATGSWEPGQVWETGFIERFIDHLSILAVEHYPSNNCFFQFGIGRPVFPEEIFQDYLTHSAGQNLVAPYLESSRLAQAAGLPFMMFETNTASCGGFQGLSDSFGAALWGLDYGLQMAYANFSGAMLHVGGQNVFYNPFTSPPTNQSSFHQWTAGAVYYSALIISEVLGASNTAQVFDVLGNDADPHTPQYAVYEHGVLSRVALFNYIDDPTGRNDYVATITVENGNVPAEVRVKYFNAESVSSKTDLRWAGQTLGNKFEVDGRLRGPFEVITIPCDQQANICSIPVRAPQFALVFLRMDDAPQLAMDESIHTYATTAHTKLHNTATIDQVALETSNGMSEKDRAAFGSTSRGSVRNGEVSMGARIPSAIMLAAMVLNVLFVLGGVL